MTDFQTENNNEKQIIYNMKMNWRKIQVTTGIFLFSITSVFANNEKGIEYFRAELFEAAKIYLKDKVEQSQGTELAEAYYFIGESYAALNQLDSAAYFFQKSNQTDPEYPYSYIGQGRLALKNNDVNSANDFFKKAVGFAKKDPAIYVAVAEVFTDFNQYDKAEEFLDKARGVKKNYSGIYVAEGNMLMSQGKTGDASARFENAILFDPNNKIAYLKHARVYKTINPDLTLDILNRLLAIDPDYIPAYAELGDVYYRKNNYTKAIEAYNRFIGIPGVPVQQLVNYASLLYFTKEYAKSLDEINQVLERDPKNFVMLRLQFYNNFELSNFALGLDQAKKFIQTGPQGDLIAQDFIYYGRLLNQSGDTKTAIDAFNKALSIDPAKGDIFKDLALAYEKEEDYSNAVIFYRKFINTDTNATLGDVFNFGRMAYNAGNQEIVTQGRAVEEIAADSLTRRNYFLLADSIFAQIVERSPDVYTGYFWRARANASLDPETTLGLAKPFYEQAVAKLEAMPEGASRNKNLIEGYRYLGYYYYLQKDFPTSKDFFQKILALDPNDEIALQVLKAIK